MWERERQARHTHWVIEEREMAGDGQCIASRNGLLGCNPRAHGGQLFRQVCECGASRLMMIRKGPELDPCAIEFGRWATASSDRRSQRS